MITPNSRVIADISGKLTWIRQRPMTILQIEQKYYNATIYASIAWARLIAHGRYIVNQKPWRPAGRTASVYHNSDDVEMLYIYGRTKNPGKKCIEYKFFESDSQSVTMSRETPEHIVLEDRPWLARRIHRLYNTYSAKMAACYDWQKCFKQEIQEHLRKLHRQEYEQGVVEYFINGRRHLFTDRRGFEYLNDGFSHRTTQIHL